ncbi:hypothetical protein PAE9249_04859 [Paenibacillus sp. CECT 9249]|uniref:MBL fold metallo-hydrolase n=1 Tax=Paenibacillus sp. CECT 9249 TaxID=2845385 RepID=UPI001E61836D|nr:MBL fold metallo-hydrolase [Paenibacillus sp. CECT 9249]CAH0122311.1 hypothetical protein PAE9249_04859 [Paenibacillus sp. CECT 9249]
MIQYSNERITVFQSALFQTTSTVVNLDDGIFIVDPTWLPAEISEIKGHVKSIQGNKQCYLLFTHGDFDHIIGYNAFPGAITIGSAGLLNHPNKEGTVGEIKDFDAKYYIVRDYEIEFPQLDIVVKRDGQQVAIGSTNLTFYLAPGHTADGLFTIVDSMGIWLAGDYLSDIELPYIYHSAIAYEQTLKKAEKLMSAHDIKLFIPGHGRHTVDRSEMAERIAVSLDYLERLKQAVMNGDESAIAKMESEHRFLSAFTKHCHQENVDIIRQEFAG